MWAMPTRSRAHSQHSAPRRGYVFLACGERYARRANIALAYLKRVTRLDIVVLRARSLSPIDHDQTIECVPPAHFTDSQASVALKTNIHRILGTDGHTWCYLDTDVIATSPQVNRIFDHLQGEVSFAQDHVDIDTLSKYVVRCGCSQPRCNHLRLEIRRRFNVQIDDGSWRPWNGGVFVFGAESIGFLDRWHAYASSTLSSEYWHPRDQGTLAAAVWKTGLQSIRPLPSRFNRILDGMYGIELHKRNRLTASQLIVDHSYRLGHKGAHQKGTPVCLHFINDTIGRVGWKNWDDVEALQRKSAAVLTSKRDDRLTPDNRIVHSLWIGNVLSKLELLTLHSFLRCGHEFHLWLYDDLATPIPQGIIVEDAAEVIPKSLVFTKRATDAECGVGRSSYGPFSDLFRYKVLYDKGGYWVDMDVTCLKPLNIKAPYVFRSHRIGVMGNLIKCPAHSRVMARTYERTLAKANTDAAWLFANRILTSEVKKCGLTDFVRRDICNEDSWTSVVRLMLEHDILIPTQWYAIHWINEVLRTLRGNQARSCNSSIPFLPDKDNPKQGSLLGRLYKEHRLCLPTDEHRLNPLNGVNGSPMARWGVRDQEHINVLLPTLNRGGAERSVVDIVTSLPLMHSAQLLVLDQTPFSAETYPVPVGNVDCEVLSRFERHEKVKYIASRVHSSPNPSLFVHLPEPRLLESLHAAGVSTIPVVQNMRSAWQTPATCFNDPGVIFVVAVSRAVANELRAYGCMKRIVVIRHEVSRQMDRSARARERELIRQQLGVSNGTALLGMVGQFKEQKDYPRAVRILCKLKRHISARLVIIGGWETVNSSGRGSYEQTRREAVALGLGTDVITLGTVPDVERYLAAFDVFLNTSLYEGLSVAMLEAKNAGCRIVASDVGGASEIDYAAKRLVSPNSPDDEFVEAILRSLEEEPQDGMSSASDGLVPFLWSMIGNYGWTYGPCTQQASHVYLASASELGKVVAIVPRPDGENRVAIGLYGDSPLDLPQGLKAKGISLRRLPQTATPVTRSYAALRFILGCSASDVHFAGIDVQVRLLLAKVLSPHIRIFDFEDAGKLWKSLQAHKTLQHRLCMDGSEYYARLQASPSGTEEFWK